MSRRMVCLLGVALFALGAGTGVLVAGRGGDGPRARVVLDNSRVTVTEVTLAPGGRREPHTRASDQIIVFLDEASYDATDAAGKKEARRRAPGDVVWHSRGEAAPLLVNTGPRPYRNLVVAIK